ncbi:MAG: hypothetical protein HY909_24835 [Deltaproteobacteria bacterium]|nr:hypothetical protein [Deltaproteobacteria bacterium]
MADHTARQFRTSLVFALALGAGAGSGCWVTTSEYDHTRTALEARVHAMETNDQQRRAQLQTAVDQATEQVRTLTAQLEQARTQTRNLADLGARLDGIEDRMRQLSGSTEDLRHAVDESAQTRTQLTARVDVLERRAGIAPLVNAADIPADNAQVLTLARTAFDARDFARARFLANALIQRAPQDPSADDAALLIARSNLGENRSATAVQDLQRFMQTYPSSDLLPDALTILAEAFMNLRLCTEAQRTLRLLLDRHGRAPAAAAARARLDAIRALPREACSG